MHRIIAAYVTAQLLLLPLTLWLMNNEKWKYLNFVLNITAVTRVNMREKSC